MAQHTPGPWSLGEGDYEDHVFGPDGYEVMGAPTYSSIHRDFYAGRMGDGHWGTTPGAFIERGDEVPKANALLTAAAPDMLEALREAELQIVYLHEKFAGTGSGETTLHKIRAAIAKAEGR